MMVGRPFTATLSLLALLPALGWGCGALSPEPEAPRAEVDLTASIQTPVGEEAPAPVLQPARPGPAELVAPAAEPELVPAAPGPTAPAVEMPPTGVPLPALPPEFAAELAAPTAEAGEEGAEEPFSALWVETDPEYGQLAQVGDQFVLFYPLRYHGGFQAIAKGTEIEKLFELTVAPVPPDDIQLIAQLANVLGVQATHYSSLNLLVIKVPIAGEGEVLDASGHNVERPGVARVKDLLRVLDAPRKQVSIEAKIVEISRELETQLGVDWGVTNTAGDFFRGATGDFDIPGSTRFGLSDFNVQFDSAPAGAHVQLDATIRALEALAKLDVISEPSMVVEVGQTARVQVGQQVPMQTSYKGVAGREQVTTDLKETGVRLLVSPLTVSEDTIRLQVWAEVSDVVEYRVTAEGIENPVINTRNAQTTVSVSDGEIIKIAGLLVDDTVKTEVKVPILGDIPFLGFFFKNWRYDSVQRDLVIFITPRIIRGPLIEPGAGLPFMGAGY